MGQRSLPTLRGRGVGWNPPNRFERLHVDRDDWTDPDDPQRTLPTDLWYPAADDAPEEAADHPFGQAHLAAPDAAPRTEPCPLVVFSHGNIAVSVERTDGTPV